MSEFLNFDEEGYPSFRIPSEKGIIEGTPANTTIYIHDFEHRGVDHIFIETAEEEEVVRGAFIWRIVSKRLSEGMFDDLVRELIDNDFEMIVCDQPSEGDMSNWTAFVDKVIAGQNMEDLEKPWEVTDGQA